MDAPEFTKALAHARLPEERIKWFGALLRREARTAVEIVGGSAVGIYLTSAAYVSQDVDLVGEHGKIEPVLHRWRFRRNEGRSHRYYWFHKEVGLVDLVGSTDHSGLPPRELATPYGPVLVGAPEPLIVRRLARSSREGSDELFKQAVLLAKMEDLDWEYLRGEARYERVESLLDKVQRARRK